MMDPSLTLAIETDNQKFIPFIEELNASQLLYL